LGTSLFERLLANVNRNDAVAIQSQHFEQRLADVFIVVRDENDSLEWSDGRHASPCRWPLDAEQRGRFPPAIILAFSIEGEYTFDAFKKSFKLECTTVLHTWFRKELYFEPQ
jgi:hypothetical protein